MTEVPKEPHLLADYFELRCLISADGLFTTAELVAALRRRRDTGRAGSGGVDAAVAAAAGQSGDSAIAPAPEEWADEGEMPVEGDQVARELLKSLGPDDDPPEGGDDDEDDDGQRILLAEGARLVIAKRVSSVGRHYPFVLDGDALGLRARTPTRRLYLFLLLASSYKYLADGQVKKATTTGFERLAVPASRRYFGDRLEVHCFGTGAVRGSRYHGNTVAAIDRMIEDMKFEASPRWQRQKSKVSSSGDRGLDIVGWIPFAENDPADLRMVMFGQCATGRNWDGKQYEASRSQWARTIDFGQRLTQVLFVSHAVRDTGGDWVDSLGFSDENIVVDRERMVALLADQHPYSRVKMSLVDKFTAMRGADAI